MTSKNYSLAACYKHPCYRFSWVHTLSMAMTSSNLIHLKDHAQPCHLEQKHVGPAADHCNYEAFSLRPRQVNVIKIYYCFDPLSGFEGRLNSCMLSATTRVKNYTASVASITLADHHSCERRSLETGLRGRADLHSMRVNENS